MWWSRQVVAYPWEKLSDLRQAIYPEGFYNVRSPSASHHANLGWGLEARPLPQPSSACVMCWQECAVTTR